MDNIYKATEFYRIKAKKKIYISPVISLFKISIIIHLP